MPALRALLCRAGAFVLLAVLVAGCRREAKPPPATRLPDVCPAPRWRHQSPERVGMDKARLEQLARLVDGAGVVVRHGYMVHRWGRQTPDHRLWSAAKPVISTLLMFAIQEGKLPGPDEPVARVEPRLQTLNDGKDAAITWRHLASQTSGYGLGERPGAAFAYNDFAIALYYDSLMHGVFREDPTAVIRQRLAEPLGFEDECAFDPGGPESIEGWLQMSVRDFARFGLLILRRGEWNGRQILQRERVEQMLRSPVPAAIPMSAGREAPMLPGQRSYGTSRTRHDTRVGPGFYSFNWWLNTPDARGRAPVPDAPGDTVLAVGLFGRAVLMIIPSLDVVLSWNQSEITDHLESLEGRETRFNTAARLIREAVVDPAR